MAWGKKKLEPEINLVEFVGRDFVPDPKTFTDETHWAVYHPNLDYCVVISKNLPYMKVIYKHLSKKAEMFIDPMTSVPVEYHNVSTTTDTENKSVKYLLTDQPFPAPSPWLR